MKTPYPDRASAVRPHDPLTRLALWLGVGLEILAALKLLGPAGGVAILLMVLTGLTFVMWQPIVTALVILAVLGLAIGRRYVRLVRERVELREREKKLDDEIPF